MQNRLLALRRAEQPPGAAVISLAFFAHDVAAANGALLGHRKRRRVAFATLEYDRNHLGNHIARPAHHHRIPDAYILAPHLVLVVQGGVRDGHPAHKDGLQSGHRRELAGASHLHLDGQHGRELFLRRVLVRDGPTRLAGDEAELLLQRERIDFIDHAVDVVGQVRAQASHLIVIGNQRLGPATGPHMLADREAPGLERLQQFPLTADLGPAFLGRTELPQGVGKKLKGRCAVTLGSS